MTNDDTADDRDPVSAGRDLRTVLASEPRQHVLRFFRDRDEPVATLDELATYLVSADGGIDDPERARIALHHVALPKLAAVGAIDYDHRGNVARYYGHSRLEALLPLVSVA